MQISFATEADVPALLNIYRQYLETPITFECAVPSEAEFAARVCEISAVYPYLVCRDGGEVVGYAYAHRQAERAAYQWNAELSIYLDPAHTGRGLGKRLYAALLELLRRQGIRTVYARVTIPNEKSEALHWAMGFRHMGTQKNAGYKDGAWRDVAWVEKTIGIYDDPEPLRSIHDVPPESAAGVLTENM